MVRLDTLAADDDAVVCARRAAAANVLRARRADILCGMWAVKDVVGF